MFAYCLNNPVNLHDENGEAADSYSGWIGELLGEWIYELITGKDHPGRQTAALETQVIVAQNKMVTDAAKTMWDAYQRGYTIQQEGKLIEAQMIVDGASIAYNFLNDTEIIDVGMSSYHSVQSARAFKKSVVYFTAPIPTPVDEVFAIGYAIKGVYHFVRAIWR